MAISTQKTFPKNRLRLIFSAFLFATVWCLLQTEGHCRAVYNSGSVSNTEVTHYEFLSRLANPCGIDRMENVPEISSSATTGDTEDTFNRTAFYESMILTANQGLLKLDNLLQAEPSLPKCEGVRLDTLPKTQRLSTTNEELLFRDIYASGVFLAAHLHIMILDRQLSVVGLNNVRDEDLNEHPESLPAWRTLRCGNESDEFVPSLEVLTLNIEELLCTVVSSANLEQRATFRGPFNRLTNTTFFRYHSSCSTLQIRDCLVIQETKTALKAISLAFNTLLNESTASSGMGGGRDHYEIHTNDIHF